MFLMMILLSVNLALSVNNYVRTTELETVVKYGTEASPLFPDDPRNKIGEIEQISIDQNAQKS